MNKPITMTIKETKEKMINIINESGLSPAVLDLIMQGIYFEIHTIAEKQAAEEEKAYIEIVKNNDIVNDDLKIGDTNESK